MLDYVLTLRSICPAQSILLRPRSQHSNMENETARKEPRSSQRRWNEHDLAHHAAPVTDCPHVEHVGDRVRYSFKHQVSRKSPVCALGHHVRAASPQAIQQGAPKWTHHLLRDHPYRKSRRPHSDSIHADPFLQDEGKEKKVNFDFEPFKPINTQLYLCDNKFHTEALAELLESDAKFGFIIMDGNGALFGTLAGNTREVIHKVCCQPYWYGLSLSS